MVKASIEDRARQFQSKGGPNMILRFRLSYQVVRQAVKSSSEREAPLLAGSGPQPFSFLSVRFLRTFKEKLYKMCLPALKMHSCSQRS